MDLGPRLNISIPSYRYRIPIINIRRSHDRLIFILGIPILSKDGFNIKTDPRKINFNKISNKI